MIELFNISIAESNGVDENGKEIIRKMHNDRWPYRFGVVGKVSERGSQD